MPVPPSRPDAVGSPPRRRWFRVGPGLILAIVACVFVWRAQGNSRLPAPVAGPPRIERTVHGISPESLPESARSAPEPGWLLETEQRESLALTPEQAKRLTALKVRWDRETKALRAALEQAEVDVQERLSSQSDGKGRVTIALDEMQKLAAPVSALSRHLADARRAWWSEASQTLDVRQRQKAEAMWARRLTPSQKTKEAN